MMECLLLLVSCVAIGCAVGIVFLSALALSARRRNGRGHRLGRWLAVHHPEWN